MTNPQRRSALARVREPHPAETAAGVAHIDPPTPTRARTAGEGTTQLNVRVRASLKTRADQAALALGVRHGKRVTMAQVIEAALDTYLEQEGL